MKSKYLLNALVLCVLVTFVSVDVVRAQESAPVKRNSPFSPNPKRKIQSNSQNPPSNTTANPAQDSKAKQTAVPVPASENPKPISIPRSDTKLRLPNSVDDVSGSLDENTVNKSDGKASKDVLPTEIYKVGIGDILLISVQNPPLKESSYFTVLKDGTIDFPLAGGMQTVAGYTTDEIERKLASKITFIENAKVSARVREYNSHSYRVLGLVDRPGEKFLQREAIPLYVVRAEAIAQSKATLAIIKRASSQVESIDLSTQKYEEIFVYAGDIVEFTASDPSAEDPVNGDQFVYLSGDFVSGGQKAFHQGLTLTQVFTVAQGFKKKTARSVIIRRKNSQGLLRTFLHDVKAIIAGQAPDPKLQPGDIIEALK